MIAASKNGAPPARRPALKPTGSSRQLQNNAGGRQQSARRVQLPNASSSGSITNPRAGARGRAPYTAQGTPSASAATTNRTRQQQQQQQQQKQQKQQKQQPAFPGGSRNFDITSSPPAVGSEQAPKIRRSNSAPDMGVMGEGEEAPVAGGSPQKTCWGGGLPPTCGPAAARAAVAAAAAQQQASAAAGRPSVGSTAGSSRYPANDRESFARTLNEEELDEVWKGLGEGVSQRGCGSEVAFDVGDSGNAPASPTGTAVSGTFPQLTANVLQRHDQLADGAGQHASVMPMPKTLGGGDNGNGRTPEEMENGTAKSSSKKSKSSGRSGQEPQQETTLLGAIVSYGIFLLWVAHLVFNVLLLWRVVMDGDYIWAICFIPGVLGILLSLHSCRKSHRRCKPVADDDDNARAAAEERRRRSGSPHACALPAHTLLLLAVVACLGMHAFAMLFCEKDMLLVLNEEILDPLCDSSLTLPLVLDGVLLSVASIKASSLCWAWVLN